jgi:hypothetical protein
MARGVHTVEPTDECSSGELSDQTDVYLSLGIIGSSCDHCENFSLAELAMILLLIGIVGFL